MLKASLLFIAVLLLIVGLAWGSIKALDRTSRKRLTKDKKDE